MTYPTSNGDMQNGSSVRICTCFVHVFARLALDLYTHSAISNKISASELTRKFIKSALLVGVGSHELKPITSIGRKMESN